MSDVMVCKRCGRRNGDRSEFCACGAFLEWHGEKVAGTGPAASETTQVVASPLVAVKPATPKSPAPVKPHVTPQPSVAPGQPGWRRCACGTWNPPDRRFCTRDGAFLGVPATAPPVEQPTTTWWHRLRARIKWGLSGPSRKRPPRSARARYRRSLGMRHRLIRALGLLTTIGVIAAAFGVAGVDPIGWVREQRWRWEVKIIEVNGARAEPEQPPSMVDDDPTRAIDGLGDRAWATTWDPDASGAKPCGEPTGSGGAAASLVVSMPRSHVMKVGIRAGLADEAARIGQWRPRTVDLHFGDGRCEREELDDVGELQDFDVDAPDTTEALLVIADAYRPKDGNSNSISISEVTFFTETSD